MDSSELITGFVVLMVLGVVVIAVVLPTVQAGIATNTQTGTSTGEVFGALANATTTLDHAPLRSITEFKTSSRAQANSTVLLTCNGTSPNATLLSFILTDWDNGDYTGEEFNITATFQIVNASNNVSVYRNNVKIATISSSATHVFGNYKGLGGASYWLDMQYVCAGAENSNITFTQVKYPKLTDYAGYSVISLENAQVKTPLAGTYLTSYTYGANPNVAALSLMNLIPLLLAVSLVLVVVGFWKLAS
jgi:hypothetical protein